MSKLEANHTCLTLRGKRILVIHCHIYSPHALQQRRAGGHGTSLNLREDPGSLPFALILVAAVAGKDSSKCGRGTTLGIIIYLGSTQEYFR
jgi:hypothetical protein